MRVTFRSKYGMEWCLDEEYAGDMQKFTVENLNIPNAPRFETYYRVDDEGNCRWEDDGGR